MIPGSLPYFLAGLTVCYAAVGSVQNFTVDLGGGVPRMLNFIKETELPANEEFPGIGDALGIDLGVLKSLQKEWLTTFDWDKEQAAINQYKHHKTTIENISLHFIHEKSGDPDAIPLLMLHGWPGSFLEMLPLIEPLTTGPETCNGTDAVFDVVVASLPGHAFSSAPPAGWSITDTARIFNTLMIEVLGYKTYAVHGTDWGAIIGYEMYSNFNSTVRATHLTLIPFTPLSPEEMASRSITLNADEQFQENLTLRYYESGWAYGFEHSTKPNTIGLALYDNPIGELAWIGEKYFAWSDPRAGTPPSVLNHNHILTEVSLAFLTKSFMSAVYTYAQNPLAFRATYTKAQTDAPLLYSNFKYALIFWPEEVVSYIGNLVFYKYHDFGGHFAGLDNPPALIDDLREIATFWK